MKSNEWLFHPESELVTDDDGFAFLGNISELFFGGKQSQYLSRYIDGFSGLDDYPNLGEGLRVKGDSDDYHNMMVHKDNIPELVRRYRDYQEQRQIKF